MSETAPRPEQVRAALEEVLGWTGISRSAQLGDLLRYVVEKTLAGDEASIKAYSIAVDVFGRPASFDPQADPIVRVQARRLRTLLERYYASGTKRGAVEIRLPLGRYVPQFVPVGARDRGAAATPQVAGDGAEDGAALRRFLWQALLGFLLPIAVVTLLVAVLRWLPTDGRQPVEAGVPAMPRISVGAFDNLSGSAELDPLVAVFRDRVVAGLSRFEMLKVVETAEAADVTLRVAVQEANGRFFIRALLSHGDANGIIWSTTTSTERGAGDTAAFERAATGLVVNLGSARGPLHMPGRSWLEQVKEAHPTLYVCELRFMAWRDSRRMEEARQAIACFDAVLAGEPDNAIALAARGSISAWARQMEAIAGEVMADTLVDEAAAAAHAVTLLPGSSFVHEMQGTVLARLGSYDAAFGVLRKAMQLNPANIDAKATLGLLQWLNEDWSEGNLLAEESLAAMPSPPSWYHATRAFNALREQRYFDAIDAGQVLAASDEEFGAAVVLAAAPRVARNDLIDRYRPMVLANPYFRAMGIMPRLAARLRPQILLDRMASGLALAGLPASVLSGPFNPDGSPKN